MRIYGIYAFSANDRVLINSVLILCGHYRVLITVSSLLCPHYRALRPEDSKPIRTYSSYSKQPFLSGGALKEGISNADGTKNPQSPL